MKRLPKITSLLFAAVLLAPYPAFGQSAQTLRQPNAEEAGGLEGLLTAFLQPEIPFSAQSSPSYSVVAPLLTAGLEAWQRYVTLVDNKLNVTRRLKPPATSVSANDVLEIVSVFNDGHDHFTTIQTPEKPAGVTYAVKARFLEDAELNNTSKGYHVIRVNETTLKVVSAQPAAGLEAVPEKWNVMTVPPAADALAGFHLFSQEGVLSDFVLGQARREGVRVATFSLGAIPRPMSGAAETVYILAVRSGLESQYLPVMDDGVVVVNLGFTSDRPESLSILGALVDAARQLGVLRVRGITHTGLEEQESLQVNIYH